MVGTVFALAAGNGSRELHARAGQTGGGPPAQPGDAGVPGGVRFGPGERGGEVRPRARAHSAEPRHSADCRGRRKRRQRAAGAQSPSAAGSRSTRGREEVAGRRYGSPGAATDVGRARDALVRARSGWSGSFRWRSRPAPAGRRPPLRLGCSGPRLPPASRGGSRPARALFALARPRGGAAGGRASANRHARTDAQMLLVLDNSRSMLASRARTGPSALPARLPLRAQPARRRAGAPDRRGLAQQPRPPVPLPDGRRTGVFTRSCARATASRGRRRRSISAREISTFDELNEVATQTSSRRGQKRVLVVLSDAETRPFRTRQVLADLRRAHVNAGGRPFLASRRARLPASTATGRSATVPSAPRRARASCAPRLDAPSTRAVRRRPQGRGGRRRPRPRADRRARAARSRRRPWLRARTRAAPRPARAAACAARARARRSVLRRARACRSPSRYVWRSDDLRLRALRARRVHPDGRGAVADRAPELELDAAGSRGERRRASRSTNAGLAPASTSPALRGRSSRSSCTSPHGRRCRRR